ncbi:VCBS repeat-containing protein [Roseomonas sp. NAR14]|uniref:VCBS repeat-containing protein n=1 Tax=Roseomonas acroporae TaxID=2937791 RepID=A0A9X1YLD2_9PROT|nr:VCBS repeat-containing protein [Roseomonas acroporae]MCK8788101.1 VCBS repeat-containing protein [Roseomonas acroporae]
MAAKYDFNGAGWSDILARQADGTVVVFSMTSTASGLPAVASGTVVGVADASWTLRAVGDFDHSGTLDMLWQNTDGAVVLWAMHNNQVVGGGLVGYVGSDWSVAGTGDFNGDGYADVLWARC